MFANRKAITHHIRKEVETVGSPILDTTERNIGFANRSNMWQSMLSSSWRHTAHCTLHMFNFYYSRFTIDSDNSKKKKNNWPETLITKLLFVYSIFLYQMVHDIVIEHAAFSWTSDTECVAWMNWNGVENIALILISGLTPFTAFDTK